jgi:preprotein translocase subunit SecY
MLCMLTLGSVATTYLAFLIDRDGIGSGATVIWLGGLSVVLGRRIVAMALDRRAWLYPAIAAPVLLLTLVIAVGGMVYLSQAQRRVPVRYGRRVLATRSSGRRVDLPLRVIPAGIQPVVAAEGMLVLIGLMGSLMASASAGAWLKGLGTWIVARVDPLGYVYWVLLFCGIVFFYFAYTITAFEEQNLAENLQKQGGLIPPRRPGRATHDYLKDIILRITLGGSLVVAGMMVVLPNIVYYITGEDGFYLILALMLLTPAVLDLTRLLEAELSLRSYEGFIR